MFAGVRKHMHILEAVLYGHMDGSGNKPQTKNSIHYFMFMRNEVYEKYKNYEYSFPKAVK